MGFGNTPIIVVVALAAFFPAALSVMNATESVQRVHVSAARVMGATPWGLIKRVYLPAVMPELITGAQLAFGNAWRALISRSEEHTSELPSLMRISYAVFCLKNKSNVHRKHTRLNTS